MRLSLCIVGCGSYARKVLDEIQDLREDIELFFASRARDRARAFCDAYGGAGYFGSYEEAVADSRVQAAYFLTPHHLHLENALTASRHSKHILMEKPLGRTIDECLRIIELARATGLTLMVAENYRYLPTLNKCLEIVADGAIGKLRLVQIQMEVYSEPTGWRANAEITGGGVFIDGGIHAVDMLVSLGGGPDRIYAARPPQLFTGAEGEDGMVVVCQLPGGAVGLINYSNGTALSRLTYWVSVSGATGHLSFVPFGNEVTVQTQDAKSTVRVRASGRGCRAMIREFRASILEDREPLTSGPAAVRDLAVVLAAYRSAELGQEVSLTRP